LVGHLAAPAPAIRSRRRALLAVAVAFTTVISTFLAPSAVFAAAFYYTCGAPNNFHAFVYHSGVSAGIKDYASETFVLDSPHPCTGGTTETSFIWPISSQTGSCEQLGWGWATGGSLRWYYTKFDNSGCVVTATTAIFPAITVGHDYHFRIYLTSNSTCGLGTQWAYEITDTTTGGHGTQCGSFSALASEMWDGFEVGTSQDQMGGAGSGNKATIGASCWATAVGGTYTCIQEVGWTPCCGTDQTFWVEGNTHDIDGNAQMSAYTTSH
jgi:hypothetical protein